ncbi:LysM peptidoglycan-binding domain-containing protein [Rhizobium sp.]
MKRSGAIWLVVGVVAIAAVLMYFVVLPQMRDGKTVGDLAQKAEEAVKDVKKTVNDAAKEVEDVADGAQELKAAALAKVARLGHDARGAADEMRALLDKGTPTAEELAAAKAKLAAALKSASELKLPADADAAATAAAAKIADGAKSALSALDTLPTDPAAAKAALADIEAKILAALPDGTVVAPAETTKPATSNDGAATTETKTQTKAADAATDTAKPVQEAEAVVPAFDILRVEKDGSTVIAGRSEPGAKVEIVNGDDVIASTQADKAGDFAAVLDNPLAAGDHSIVLKSTTKDGKSSTSEEVATVSVPKDASGELLAMVTKPGEASKIITAPEAKDTELASSKSVTADASSQAANTTDAAKATAQDVAKVEEPAKSAAAVVVAMPDLPASSTDIASNPPVVAQDATGNTEQQIAKADPATEQNTATPADASQAEKRQPVGAPEVMVSAVELEGDRIFIAGNARPGAMVRIYADDQVVAEARTDKTGRFVADGTIKLAVGNHTIRADVLSADGAKVEFRASVPFFRPEGDLAAVASADPVKQATSIEPLANGTFDKARDEAGKALNLLQGLYADGKMPTTEELAAARSSAEIALKSLSETRVAADVDPIVADMANKVAEEAGKALGMLKAVPADVAAFKSALADVEAVVGSVVKPDTHVASAEDANTIASKSAVKDMAKAATQEVKPADASQTVDKAGDDAVSAADVKVTSKVERLKATGDAAADTPSLPADPSASQQTASADQPKVIEQAPLTQSEGSVIIRRGDTLWQISRRVYGKGVRYTTIYVANQGQIEDPDRIKPGQIFSMPGKWLDNAEELHKKRLDQHRKQ